MIMNDYYYDMNDYYHYTSPDLITVRIIVHSKVVTEHK